MGCCWKTPWRITVEYSLSGMQNMSGGNDATQTGHISLRARTSHFLQVWPEDRSCRLPKHRVEKIWLDSSLVSGTRDYRGTKGKHEAVVFCHLSYKVCPWMDRQNYFLWEMWNGCSYLILVTSEWTCEEPLLFIFSKIYITGETCIASMI